MNVRQRSFVGGNIQVEDGGGANVQDTTVDGDIQYESNRLGVLADRNRVFGNIQVSSNRGGVRLRSNRVDGDLQCESNVPAPVGGANTVNGDAEGQCTRLVK